MLSRRVWMGHVNSAQIAIVGVRSGWAGGASALGSRADTWGADGGDSDGARIIWVEAACAKLRVWVWSSGLKFKKKWCKGERFGCECARFGECERSEDQRFDRVGARGKQERAVVDCGRVDTVDVVAGAPVVDDSAGAFAGGVSLFASGAGDANRSIEPGLDGAGADDDVVSDAACAAGSGAGRSGSL